MAKFPLRLVELEDRRVPATYTVTTTSGGATAGSLATAIAQANSNVGADTIIFGSLFDIAQTITLTTGELAISGSLTITGPSAGVTINGNSAGRVFNISGIGNFVVGMSDLTITGGKVTGADQGGGMLIADEAVTLTRCTIRNNAAAAAGGGVAVNGGSLTVQDSTFSNNTTAAAGGGAAVNGGSLTVQGSTFSGNSGPGGGAMYFNGSSIPGGFTVRNSTLSGNSATSTIGGGILLALAFKGTCTVQNSTLTGNSAKSSGGGISRAQFSTGLITIESSIVSGNLSLGTGDDIGNGGTVTVIFSAIGDPAGFTLSGANNLAFGDKLLLGPLANNGGATLTHLPAQKSPLMDKGSNPAGMAFDQRGKAYPRALNAVADIGAIDVIGFLIVKNTSDSGMDSLRQLISDANYVPGTHTITFDPEFFKAAQAIVLTGGNLSVTDVLTIVGPGADKVTIDGNQIGSVFSGNEIANFSASGMTITGAQGSALHFSSSKVATTVVVDSCVITGNSSSGDGGGISVAGDGSGLTVTKSTVSNNTAASAGGGISVAGKGSGLTMTDSTVSNNRANNGGGGGISVADGSVTMTGNTVSNNTATSGGGGGIAIAKGSLTMTGSTVSNNSATSGGGGIAVPEGGLSVTNCTVSNNTANTGNGGGMLVGSGLTILNCMVSHNTATSGSGGGMFCDGTLRMDKCSIFDNMAKLGGGLRLTTPVAEANQTSMEITYSTFSGNQATSSEGGAIWLNNANDPGVDSHSITDCTIVNNKAALLGGGIRSIGPESIVIGSTIVAQNAATSGPDIYRNEAPVITMTHSAVGSSNGFALTGFNNLPFNIDLKLGPLADNGGPTLTHLPAINSPLVNTAPPASSYATDQRGGGFVRPIGGAEDIGAVERQELVVRNTNDVGPGSLRQAVADAKQLSGPDTITFDPAVFATPQTITLTSGEILITSSLTLQGPGSALVTVSGNEKSRVFNVFDSTSTIDVFINGITITKGKSTANGGGILNQSENLTLDHCTIAGNTANNGGGIGTSASASMTIQSCTIINNVASLSGGGMFGDVRNMSVNGSTFSGNMTFNEDENVFGDGGGLRLFLESGFTPVFRNSTISGNTCTGTGGGLVFETGLIIFQNCTIAKNTTKVGGGLAWFSSPIGFQLESTIIDGNIGTDGAPDVFAPFGTGHVTAISCAISSLAGIGSFINQGGNLIAQNIKLAPLADNGGPTFTHSLLPGSPAINAGSNPAVLKTDQRGYLRSYGGVTDIGSLEVQPAVITVNSGQSQRSRITSITVTFTASLDVTIFQNPGAVTLTRTAATSTGTVGTVVTIGSGLQVAPGAGNSNTITLSFTNAAIGGVEYGSLADGRWQLAIPSVSNYQSPLNDPILRRVFGDENADGTVDGTDLAAFGAVFGSTGPSTIAFDFNADGTVDALDFGEFGNRFGVTL